MIATVLVIAIVYGLLWWLARLGAKNTRGWWLRDFFAKASFYVAIIVGMVVGRQFDFPSRLLLALPSSLFISVLIASPMTLIYYFRVVKNQAHLRPKGRPRVDEPNV
jgi:hypothetical protein